MTDQFSFEIQPAHESKERIQESWHCKAILTWRKYRQEPERKQDQERRRDFPNSIQVDQ